MTLMMIIKTEKTLKEQQLGDLDWLYHGEVEMYDQVSLYQPHRVCKTCFAIFKQIEDLKEVEKGFIKALGIPTVYEKEEEKVQSGQKKDENEDPLAILKKKEDDRFKMMNITKLYRYRIMIQLRDIKEFNFPGLQLKRGCLSLEYSLLNTTKTTRIHIPKPVLDGIEPLESLDPFMIDKLRVFYFFAPHVKFSRSTSRTPRSS